MNLDDEICLCFHVTKRKVINYARVEKPQRASQMTGCFGAGTGCGWCRPFLEKVFRQVTENSTESFPSVEEYSAQRKKHIQSRKSESSDESGEL